MTTIEDQVKAKLASLRVAYYKELPNKVADLAGCFDRWQQSQEPQLLHDCYRMAHSLAGSGALYDAAELGGKAKELELLIKSAAINKTRLGDGEIARSREFMASLATMAAALRATIAP